MKLFFIDQDGKQTEKSFKSVYDALTEVYRAGMLGWFVCDENYNPINPILLTEASVGKRAVLKNGRTYEIKNKKGGKLNYIIGGLYYDPFGQGRGTPSSSDSLTNNVHVAYVTD